MFYVVLIYKSEISRTNITVRTNLFMYCLKILPTNKNILFCLIARPLLPFFFIGYPTNTLYKEIHSQQYYNHTMYIFLNFWQCYFHLLVSIGNQWLHVCIFVNVIRRFLYDFIQFYEVFVFRHNHSCTT